MMISMDKEGDSTILFRNSEGIPLAEITFTPVSYTHLDVYKRQSLA